MIGSDLCELKGEHYPVAVDYFSRYPEVIKLTTTTPATVISTLGSIISWYGIPGVIMALSLPLKSLPPLLRHMGFNSSQAVPDTPRVMARQNELSKP